MPGRARARLVGPTILAATLMLAIGAVALLRPPGEREASRVVRDVPAPLAPRTVVATPAEADAVRPAEADSAPAASVDEPAAPGAAEALVAELRSNHEAIGKIQTMIARSDADAEGLKAQVAQQEETIAAQRRVLADNATAEDKDGAQAGLAAAVGQNETARAALTRYETTRSTLLQQVVALQSRNAAIVAQLR